MWIEFLDFMPILWWSLKFFSGKGEIILTKLNYLRNPKITLKSNWELEDCLNRLLGSSIS